MPFRLWPIKALNYFNLQALYFLPTKGLQVVYNYQATETGPRHQPSGSPIIDYSQGPVGLHSLNWSSGSMTISQVRNHWFKVSDFLVWPVTKLQEWSIGTWVLTLTLTIPDCHSLSSCQCELALQDQGQTYNKWFGLHKERNIQHFGIHAGTI